MSWWGGFPLVYLTETGYHNMGSECAFLWGGIVWVQPRSSVVKKPAFSRILMILL